jgi:predicted nucleic acid-binding protein
LSSIAYLDTSALVKQYVIETGTDWVRALLKLDRTPTVLTSLLTIVETICAFARRRREGVLSAEHHARILISFDYDTKYRFNILSLEPIAIETARRLANQHPLRAYDAVHLATAWLANEKLVQAGRPPLTFICADDRLLSVAQAEGLSTDNPNHHP